MIVLEVEVGWGRVEAAKIICRFEYHIFRFDVFCLAIIGCFMIESLSG